MYSNKENVNILTSLLVAHGVRHAVVCPGSRNSPIVHNLTECPDITCHPVTDERSAGFYALGMSLCLRDPVAVCVTSGTALLNLAPAVAEALYQHASLVVISADRPQQWIDQLDGQTLLQQNALGSFVRKSVSLPEPGNDEERWYCNRLIREALLECTSRGGGPVHVNVPISEPLFQFDVEQLPSVNGTSRWCGIIDYYDIEEIGLRADFWSARHPLIIIGQNRETVLKDYELQHLKEHAVILYEPLGSDLGTTHFDEVLYAMGDDESLRPDFVLYGGMIVSKRLKQFLRKATDASFWELSLDGQLHETFMRTKGVLESDFGPVLLWLNQFLENPALFDDSMDQPLGEVADTSDYVRLWKKQLDYVSEVAERAQLPYSQMAAVKYYEQQLLASGIPANQFYANSTAVRLSCIFSTGYVYCNRGVNGIEGSLSTAAGFSLVAERPVFIVIGDLSFFYDSNALWNGQLKGNLRILLLNNGGGAIFRQLPVGDGRSSALDYVMGSHQTSAEGICQSYGVEYLSARNEIEMEEGIQLLLQKESTCPLLLEVFTDAATDAQVYQDYYRSLSE